MSTAVGMEDIIPPLVGARGRGRVGSNRSAVPGREGQDGSKLTRTWTEMRRKQREQRSAQEIEASSYVSRVLAVSLRVLYSLLVSHPATQLGVVSSC
jgi:hypothetical protein